MEVLLNPSPRGPEALGYVVHPALPGWRTSLSSQQLILASFLLCMVSVCVYVAIAVPQGFKARIRVFLLLELVSVLISVSLAVFFVLLLSVMGVTL